MKSLEYHFNKKMQSFYFVFLAAVLCLFFCHVNAQFEITSEVDDDGDMIYCLETPKGNLDTIETLCKIVGSMM
ncbi:hypothetical protein NPIL_457121 [Nephila pilipes]|uniref:Spider venom protein n=1 Tax=Nephila pilipes TaxID=299642 RepID=A0A8X6PCV3_NEPPI|nr:hypothetical protein NPIL_457121 [Nephila pilipes]